MWEQLLVPAQTEVITVAQQAAFSHFDCPAETTGSPAVPNEEYLLIEPCLLGFLRDGRNK